MCHFFDGNKEQHIHKKRWEELKITTQQKKNLFNFNDDASDFFYYSTKIFSHTNIFLSCFIFFLLTTLTHLQPFRQDLRRDFFDYIHPWTSIIIYDLRWRREFISSSFGFIIGAAVAAVILSYPFFLSSHFLRIFKNQAANSFWCNNAISPVQN